MSELAKELARPKPLYVEEKGCRACGSSLVDVLDLGPQDLVGFYPPGEAPSEEAEPKVPLVLALCTNVACSLAQLRHTVDRDRLFRDGYWYQSAVNPSMVTALQEIVLAAAVEVGGLHADDTVVDIGANDGTLLQTYHTAFMEKVQRVAFEPARNLKEACKRHCEVLVPEYFGKRSGSYSLPKAKVITAVAMMYDLTDLHGFVESVRTSLQVGGVFVAQFGDAQALISQCAFDAICHEHLEYYTLKPLVRLFAMHDLCVTKVQTNMVNGGSLRLFVKHSSVGEPDYTVKVRQRLEEPLYTAEAYWELEEKIEQRKHKVRDLLLSAWLKELPVTAYGASTKGLTLLQTFGLGGDLVASVADRNPEKLGLQYGRTGVRVVSEEVWRLGRSLALVLPWHFKEGILEREKEWLRGGGQFLFPLPEPVVVDW